MKERSEQPDETPMVLFQSEDGAVRLNVRLDGETVWLPQRLMALLFDCSTDNISLHLRNIFEEGELNENSVTEEFSVTATDGKKYRTRHYNLDVIIAVGYRVNSRRATQFRIWATSVLKKYIVKGFALNDERLGKDEHDTSLEELERDLNARKKKRGGKK
jgi:hypothetical protein